MALRPATISYPHLPWTHAVLRLLPYADGRPPCPGRATHHPRRLAVPLAASASMRSAPGTAQAGTRRALACCNARLNAVQIVYGAVVPSDDPAALDHCGPAAQRAALSPASGAGHRASRPPSGSSHSHAALGRQDISAEGARCARGGRRPRLSASECAALPRPAPAHRQHAPDGVAPDSLAQLEDRLRAALPFEARNAADDRRPTDRPATSRSRRRENERRLTHRPEARCGGPSVAARRMPDCQPSPAAQPINHVRRGLRPPSPRSPPSPSLPQTAGTEAPPSCAFLRCNARSATNPARRCLRPAVVAARLLALALALWLLLPSLWRGRTAMQLTTDHRPLTSRPLSSEDDKRREPRADTETGTLQVVRS